MQVANKLFRFCPPSVSSSCDGAALFFYQIARSARLSAVEAVLSSTDGRRSGAWAISSRYRKSGSATLAQQSHPGAVAGKGRIGLHLTEDEVVVHGTDLPIGRI